MPDIGASRSESPVSALVSSDTTGPMQTLAGLRNAALRLSQSGHSSAAQHSDVLKDCTAGHCQP
jgi:hypothetical protein